MIILLLYSRIEAIRQIGRSLLDDTTNRGVLRNVDALLRRNVETPAVGLMFTKSFQGHGTFTGRIMRIETDEDGEKIYNVKSFMALRVVKPAWAKGLLTTTLQITKAAIHSLQLPILKALAEISRVEGNCRQKEKMIELEAMHSRNPETMGVWHRTKLPSAMLPKPVTSQLEAEFDKENP